MKRHRWFYNKRFFNKAAFTTREREFTVSLSNGNLLQLTTEFNMIFLVLSSIPGLGLKLFQFRTSEFHMSWRNTLHIRDIPLPAGRQAEYSGIIEMNR